MVHYNEVGIVFFSQVSQPVVQLCSDGGQLLNVSLFLFLLLLVSKE